ncbi:MAG TPA: ABC transporter permease, partial [Acidimicrobiales bacterium]
AAGRRTESAFPRFVAKYGIDAVGYATRPVPQLATLPEVASATRSVSPLSGRPTCACHGVIDPTNFSVTVLPANPESLSKLVAGRWPDESSPYQVLASFTLQQDFGVQLGTVIRVPFYAASQLSAYFSATGAEPTPTGPTLSLHVVGFEASEGDFPAGAAPSYSLYTTHAFARTVVPRTAAANVYFVRLHRGAAGLARFGVDVNSLAPAGLAGDESIDHLNVSVQASIHPQAVGWWLLAVLAALVGLLVIGQALARQSVVESEDHPTLATLGLDRPQLVALSMARNLVVAIAGAAGAVGLATALSPLAPVGEARLAEPSTGVAFDGLVLVLGALVIVVIVVALGVWPALRAARTLRADDDTRVSRPSAIAAQLAAMGAAPSAVIGVRQALQRGRGRAAVPVGTALAGTVLAVTALCGTAVFGSSLSHLTATPALYGDPFQINFNLVGDQPDPALLTSLEHDPAVTGITRGLGTEVSVDKVPVGLVAAAPLRGPLLLSTVDGKVPDADGQMGLGAATMRQVGAHVGSVVTVTVTTPSGGRRTVDLRVVSRISFPVLAGISGLGSGAAMTIPGYEDAVCPPGSGQARCQQAVIGTSNGGMLVRFVSGARGSRAISHYVDTYRTLAVLPSTPTSLVNFGEAVNFPLIFGVMLVVFGAATLLHLLVVSVARRRREIGLLKVLGFVNRQVASAVSWQATTLALVGIVVGVPLGVAVGQGVWKAFATNLGVVPVSVVPVGVVVALALGAVVVANVLAIAPALVATRSRPGQLLRER